MSTSSGMFLWRKKITVVSKRCYVVPLKPKPGVALLFYHYFGIMVQPHVIVGVKITAHSTTHKTDKDPSHPPRQEISAPL